MDFIAAGLRSLLLCLLLCSAAQASGLTGSADEKFWAFSADGITVFGPYYRWGDFSFSRPSDKDKALEAQTKESLCNGEDCGWGYPVTTGFGHVVVPNYKLNRVIVYDIDYEYVQANVPTCRFPFRVDVAAWRHEVYVHCGDGNIDTLNMANWGLKQPLVDAVLSSSKFVHGKVVLNEAVPEYAYSTNNADPGYHKVHLESRAIHFVNFESEGCNVASDLTISGHNQHGFIRCSNGKKHFILEINLENDKVVQKIDISGTPFVTKSGLLTVVVDDQQHKLHIFKAKGIAKPSELEATVDGIEGFSQLEFVSSADESVHIAVVSSLTQYRVLLVDMNNFNNTKVMEYHESHNSTALDKVHGAQRNIGCGFIEGEYLLNRPRILIAVSAQELNTAFMMDITVAGDVPWGGDVAIGQVQGIQGDSIKMIYVKEPEYIPPYSTGSRNVASNEALERLEVKVVELQNSLWGEDLSNNFWVFADDGLRVLKADDGSVQTYFDGTSLCGGQCLWGYPETDGDSFVVIPKQMDDRVLVFDAHTGGIIADVKTCSSPFRLEVAPWRNEIYVHCSSRPEDQLRENPDGVIDVISSSSWGVRNPFIDAVSSSKALIHGDVYTSPEFPQIAWSTNYADAGLHKINLETRQSTFIELGKAYGCNNAVSLAISAKNRHGFLACNHGDFSLEMDLDSDQVVHVHKISGIPHATKDGKFIAMASLPGDNEGSLQFLKAQEQGKASQLINKDVDAMHGFSQLVFVERGDVHVAVATSLQQNKVLLVDMDTFDSRVLDLPEDASGNSTAPVGAHGAQRHLAAGVLEDGRMVAVVSAQRLETVHIIDMGRGKFPLMSATVKHDVEGIPGVSPKMLFVPLASRTVRQSTVHERVPSMGLFEAVRQKLDEARGWMELEAEQMKQQLSSLDTTIAQNKQQVSKERMEAIKEREAAIKEREQLEQQLSSLSTAMEQAREEREAARKEREELQSKDQQVQRVAIAGVVLACVALAAVAVVSAIRPPLLAHSEKPQPCQQGTGKHSKESHNHDLDSSSLGSAEFGGDITIKTEV